MPRRPPPPAAPDGEGAPRAEGAGGADGADGADSAVERAAADLYSVDLDRFVAERDARARALRAQGDAAGARAVAALRRPTQAAWLVNLLVREQPEVVEALLGIGDALRDAGLEASALRSLSAQRRQVVDALVRDAARLGLARGARVSADTRGEVQSTLEAALADPQVADEVRGGRLLRTERRAGFPVPGDAAPVRRPAPARASAPPPARGRDQRGERERRAREERERRERRAAQEAAHEAAQEAVRAARRALEAARRAAGEAEDARRGAEERVEHLREQLQDAQRRAAEEALAARAAAGEADRHERALADAEAALARFDDA